MVRLWYGSTARVDAKPTHVEVQRRLCWFVGSLFMEMPRPPPVESMHSWSVLTPFYAEDLLYSARELAGKNEDGISVRVHKRFPTYVCSTPSHNLTIFLPLA